MATDKKQIPITEMGEAGDDQYKIVTQYFTSVEIKEGPKIGRVPEILRKSNETCFTPSFIAFGPYHHANEERNYQRGKQLKIQLMQKFYKGVDDRGGSSSSSIKQHYEKVREVASEARNWYSEDDSSTKDMTDAEFAKMMFLDGRALLQFMDCFVGGDWSRVNIKTHEKALILRDLLLLENQLPLKVLSVWKTQTEVEELFCKLPNMRVSRPPHEVKSATTFLDQLAHCFRKCSRSNNNHNDGDCCGIHNNNSRKDGKELLHLLHIYWKKHVCVSEYNKKQQQQQQNTEWYTFRSIKDLKAAGIEFSRSASCRYTDVNFKPDLNCIRSRLSLPAIVVDDHTQSLLLNLASYEMSSPDADMVYAVTSYIWFMDSLIDSAADVEELRRNDIILNCLGSDEIVAKVFNDIAKDLVVDLKAFGVVKKGIEGHYRSWCKKWINEFVYTHFRNPWTILLLIGAVLGLGMTFLTTYITVRDFLKGKK